MEKPRTETISVIVPIYKVEPYLRQCVDSILAQTYRDLEIILVDDGSPDNCGRICDEYAKKDPRVVVIHQKNSGLSSARNAGIKRAGGAYLNFVDSDDFLAPAMLEKLHQSLKKADAELSFCYLQYVNEAGENIPGDRTIQHAPEIGSVWSEERFWEQRRTQKLASYVGAWAKLYHRELFAAVYYPDGKLHEDEFVLHRIIGQCSRIAEVPERLYFYRQRADSITAAEQLDPRRLDKIEAYLERCEYFRQKGSWKMLQFTLFDIIDRMEVFAYESDLAGRPLPERYAPLKEQIIAFTHRPVKIYSPVYWGVVLSYRWGIFPYRLIRTVYWGWVNFRKKK